jgi:hypothetical protein
VSYDISIWKIPEKKRAGYFPETTGLLKVLLPETFGTTELRCYVILLPNGTGNFKLRGHKE